MRTLEVEVVRRQTLATGIVELALEADNRGLLPGYGAGAHVDVWMPGGLSRSYSLTTPAGPSGANRYVIAVGLSASSRGGSAWIHEHAHPGVRLQVGEPRNLFELRDDPAPVLFIAGGIGITPLQLMAQQRVAQGRPFHMVYAARSRTHAAYLPLLDSFGARATTHFDDEAGGKPLDVAAVLHGIDPATRIYCCGPGAMMDAVRECARAAGHDASKLHFESFTPAAEAGAQAGRFTVRLDRSGREIDIEPGRSILDTLEDHGVVVPSVCREGVCGSCECMVLEGEVDHHDQILSEDERAANRSMMICVSRARGERVVLDL